MSFTNFHRLKQELDIFDVRQATIDIINESSSYLSDMIRGQLALGKDSKGGNVLLNSKNYYSDRTIFSKEHDAGLDDLARETGWITNYMSGDFYYSIYVAAIGTEFIFDSDISYFGDILQRSGEVIMELSEENIEIFKREVLYPQLQLRFNKSLQLV